MYQTNQKQVVEQAMREKDESALGIMEECENCLKEVRSTLEWLDKIERIDDWVPINCYGESISDIFYDESECGIKVSPEELTTPPLPPT